MSSTDSRVRPCPLVALHHYGNRNDVNEASRTAASVLNDAQKAKLNVLADKMEAQRTAFIGKTADPRAEMQALVAGEKFDRTRAQTLLDEKTRAVQTSSPEVISAMADFYDSLRPEQQAKVREFAQSRAERADKKHHGSHHGS